MRQRKKETMSAIILAGGLSKRMKTNKAFLKIGGKEIIQAVINKLFLLFEEIIVVTNSLKDYERLKISRKNFSLKIVPDKILNRGPLGGIYSGLMASSHFYNFTTACDTPFINLRLINYMKAKTDKYHQVIAPRIGKYIEPLYAFYSKDCITSLERELSSGQLKIIDFLKCVRVKYILKEEVEKFDPRFLCFFNINNFKDYQLALKLVCRYKDFTQKT